MNLIDLCIVTENDTKRKQKRIFVTKVQIDLQKSYAEHKRASIGRKIFLIIRINLIVVINII